MRRKNCSPTHAPRGARRRDRAGRPRAGPVHLNFPFREPLIPAGPLGPMAATHATAVFPARAPPSSRCYRHAEPSPEECGHLAGRLAGIERGLIVAGPPGRSDAARGPGTPGGRHGLSDPGGPALAGRLGPHDGSHVIAAGDLITRPGRWIDAHRPEIVLRFGAMPTSKPILEMLRAVRPALLVVDGAGGWREPALLPATFVHADEVSVALGLADAWQTPGRAPGPRAAEPASRWTATGWRRTPSPGPRFGLAARPELPREPFEPRPFTLLADLLPDGGDPVGRQFDAGARHGRLSAGRRAGRPLLRQPRRQRDRRRGLERARRPRRPKPVRSSSSSATCRSCTTSTPWSRRDCTASPRRSCSSTTTAAGSSRSCRRPRPSTRRRPPGRLRGAVRDAARRRLRADSRRRRRLPHARGGGRAAETCWRRRSARRASACWRYGRTGSGTSPCIARRRPPSQAALASLDRRRDALMSRIRGRRRRVRSAGRRRRSAAAADPRLHRPGRRLGTHFRALRRVATTIQVDLLGHGRSDAPCRPGHATRSSARLRTWPKSSAGLDGGPADVLGYSFGARVALMLAIAEPAGRKPPRPREPVGRVSRPGRTGRPSRRRRGPAPSTSNGTAFPPSWPTGRPAALRRHSVAGRGRTARRLHAATAAQHARGLAGSLRGAGQGAM